MYIKAYKLQYLHNYYQITQLFEHNIYRYIATHHNTVIAKEGIFSVQRYGERSRTL